MEVPGTMAERQPRLPRVRITYEVETPGGMESRELPFVVGVLADLAGHPEQTLPALRERRFVEINASNFDAVVQAVRPRLVLEVANRLGGANPRLKVELRFGCLADFEPEPVARQAPALWEAIQAGRPGCAQQLDEIVHAPEFRQLEAAWRGLHFLVQRSPASPLIKIRVLAASKADLAADFRAAPDMQGSALFEKVWTEPCCCLGGEPFGAVIGDYEFDESPEDIDLLERISEVAASAHAPFLAAASPRMFALEDFCQLNELRDVRRLFQHETSRWRAFRQTDDARYVALVLPRLLLRVPYGEGGVPVRAFPYEEKLDAPGGGPYVWGNSAYALGTRLTEAFAAYGWCAWIRGVESGGLVQELPVHCFLTDEGDVACKSPIEVALTDMRLEELAQLGFIGLCWCKGTDFAAFFATPMAAQPRQYMMEAATRSDALYVRLPYLLAVSRFAHYVRAMMRDSTSTQVSRETCEELLNAWISQYVILDDDASEETKAQFPLREARIAVDETPEGPGHYCALLYLRPHFQMDDPGLCARLVVKLPPARQT